MKEESFEIPEIEVMNVGVEIMTDCFLDLIPESNICLGHEDLPDGG